MDEVKTLMIHHLPKAGSLDTAVCGSKPSTHEPRSGAPVCAHTCTRMHTHAHASHVHCNQWPDRINWRKEGFTLLLVSESIVMGERPYVSYRGRTPTERDKGKIEPQRHDPPLSSSQDPPPALPLPANHLLRSVIHQWSSHLILSGDATMATPVCVFY
jgi:hypothetical protein